jgi:hypothetical protein
VKIHLAEAIFPSSVPVPLSFRESASYGNVTVVTTVAHRNGRLNLRGGEHFNEIWIASLPKSLTLRSVRLAFETFLLNINAPP